MLSYLFRLREELSTEAHRKARIEHSSCPSSWFSLSMISIALKQQHCNCASTVITAPFCLSRLCSSFLSLHRVYAPSSPCLTPIEPAGLPPDPIFVPILAPTTDIELPPCFC